MTSNEHYGALNARFEVRAARLRRLGYVYAFVPTSGRVNTVGVFTATRAGRVHVVCAPLVMHADDVVWADYIAEAERFVN